MGASLGDLIISIAADLAKLEVGMSRAEYITAQTSRKIDKAMGVASDAIAGLAAGMVSMKTVDMFADNVNEAIEAAAAFEKLSKTTGMAADTLSAYKETADKSGTSLQVIVGASQTLTKNMLETAQGTGRARRSFEDLGLSVKDSSGHLKDTDKFMLEVGRRLVTLDSEAQKVAYAMKTMGTSDVIPFLEDLAQKGAAAALVTNAQAREAEAYMRTLRELSSANQQFFNLIAQQITPALNVLARTWLEVKTGAGSLNATVKDMAAQNLIRQWAFDAALAIGYLIDGFRTLWSGIQAVGTAVGLVAVFFVESFQSAGTIIGTLVGVVSELGRAFMALDMMRRGQFMEGWKEFNTALFNVGQGMIEVKDTFSTALSNIGSAGKQFFEGFRTRADDLAAGSWATKIFDNIAKITNGVDNLTKAGKGHADVVGKLVVDAYDGLMKKLDVSTAKFQAQLDFMRKFGYATQETEVATTAAALNEAAMVKTLEERAKREQTTVQALRERALAEAAKNDAVHHALDIETEYANMNKSEIEALGQTIEKLKEQAATYGQLDSATTRYRIKELEAMRDSALLIDKESKVAKDLQEQIEKLYNIASRQDALQGMRDFIDSLKQAGDWTGRLASGFLDGVSHGIQNAREMLKQFLSDLIAIVTKKWFLQFVAGMVGGTTGEAIAGQAAQVGAGSLASLVWGSVGSIMSAGAGSLVGILGTGFASNVATLGVALSGGTAAVGGFATAISAAIPVVGAIVAAGAAIYSIFGSHGGGRKSGGSFFGQFDAMGNLTSDLTGSLDRSHYLQDETQNDADMRAAVQDVGRSYAAWAARLGGTPGQYRFGLGYNMDPAGSAPSMVSSLVRDAQGHQIFMQSNRDVGRSQGEVTTEMQLQAQRAILATLQDSNLPHEIANILDTVVATTATADQIQAVLKAAQEAADVMKALGVLNIKGLDITALRGFQREGESISDTFTRIATAWTAFNDSFMTDAQKLAAAQTAVTDAFTQLGIAVPSSNEDFYNLVHSLDLSTEAGRHMFEVLMQIAPAFQTVQNAATAAVQQFYSLATQLSSSFGQSYARMNLDAAIQAWRAVDTNIGANFDVEGALRDIINTGSFSAVLPYIQSLGPQALGVFNQLLAAYQAWQQAMNASGSSGGTYTPPVFVPATPGGFTPSGPTPAEQAMVGIQQWISQTMLSQQLSPLSGADQLDFAHNQYVENLMSAQGGNVGALGAFTGMAQQYLEAARAYFGSSSQYQEIYAAVMGQAGGLAGLDDANRPTSALDSAQNTDAIIAAIDRLTQQVAAATLSSGTQIAGVVTRFDQAIRDGSLTFGQ